MFLLETKKTLYHQCTWIISLGCVRRVTNPSLPNPQAHHSVLSYTNSFREEASQINLYFRLPVI